MKINTITPYRTYYPYVYSFRGTSPVYNLESFDTQSIKSEIYSKVPALKNKTFGMEEYKQLHDGDKQYLRELIQSEYENCYKQDFSREDVKIKSSIKNDADFFLNISDKIKTVLKKDHPEGYNLIALGRSPAIFAKIMQYQGDDVKIIPFSRISVDNNYHNIDFKEYFAKFGLTNEALALSPNKTVIFDYFISPHFDSTGTIYKLINALKSAQIPVRNLNEREHGKLNLNPNLYIDSFYRVMLTNSKIFSNAEFKLLDKYFGDNHIKTYSVCPKMECEDNYKNIEKFLNDFEWSCPAKLINFAILDKLANK